MSTLYDTSNNEIVDKKVFIVEGFDMVGKTTAIKNFLPDYDTYFANHDLTDKVVGRDKSWVIGYGVLDLLSQIHSRDIKLVINRGVASSYVYSILYDDQSSLDERVLQWYRHNDFFVNQVGHIYVSHFNEVSARQIYENSLHRETNPNELSAKYDRFNSFEEYWELYQEADRLFNQTYRKLGINPLRIVTLENYEYLINATESLFSGGDSP